MKEATMRNLIAALAAVLVLALLSIVGCGKEAPGPTPEPTPIVIDLTPGPSATPSTDAVCFVANLPSGTPPICKDAAGAQVVCPVDTSGLSECK
jgi:hypothetical protein